MVSPPETSRARNRRLRIESSLRWLERYRPIVDSWSDFAAGFDLPIPADLFAPPGVATVESLSRSLAERDVQCETFSFAPNHLRAAGVEGSGALPEVVFGFAFPQGVVSALAPQLLEPKASDLILDPCAAPGGKTLALAALSGAFGNTGGARIVAGDLSPQRVGLLVQSMARHGVAETVCVETDATKLPRSGPFDAILLDAPCSGEGTFRTCSPRFDPKHSTNLVKTAAIQRKLLTRCLDLLAVGGRLVYATCTFAPEENEAVLTRVLSERPEIEVEPVGDSVPGIPGLQTFENEVFDERLTHARRIFPHHTGSWGFFLCKLRKVAEPATRRWLVEPTRGHAFAEDAEARRMLCEFLEERFGVARSATEDYDVIARGRDLWLLKRHARSDDGATRELRVVAPGLRALRDVKRKLRPTNALIRRLDSAITRQVVEVPWETACEMLEGRTVPSTSDLRGGTVAIRTRGRVIGTGFVKGGEVQLELPRSWR